MSKTAIVTGGTGGLGSALAIALGQKGYRVLSLYRRSTDSALALEAKMQSLGIEGRTEKQDITDPGVVSWLARLDIVQSASELVLVNNACAPFEPKPFHLLEWDDVSIELDTAAKGAFHCVKGLLRDLVRTRGVVLNVLTEAVRGEAPKGFGGYVIAKSALLGMTRALAAEYAPRGLRVFSVSPGFMATPLTAAWDPRLRAAMESGARDVSHVAAAMAELVCNPATPGKGEDYPL